MEGGREVSKRCISVEIECPYAIPCDSVDLLCWCAEQFRKVKEPQVYSSIPDPEKTQEPGARGRRAVTLTGKAAMVATKSRAT